MKWVVLTEAPDQLIAEMWRDLLLEASVPAIIRPGDTTTFLGVTAMPCRLMVPEGREDEAQAVLALYFSGAPEEDEG